MRRPDYAPVIPASLLTEVRTEAEIDARTRDRRYKRKMHAPEGFMQRLWAVKPHLRPGESEAKP